MLATGGVGQLYAVTTNPKVATADGWALAHRAGAQLRDLEFLQFHPTALKLPGVNPAPLISEAVRGAGALLVDRDGRRFALDADPRGELAPRDVVARAVAAADATGGAWLDARVDRGLPDAVPRHHRHARSPRPRCRARPPPGGAGAPLRDGRRSHRSRGARQPCRGSGPWARWRRTGVHGANRLASNSLLEGLVFADRAGRMRWRTTADGGAPRPAGSRVPASAARTPAPTTAASESGARCAS